MRDAARTEIEELHRFFQDWFRGELPDTDEAFARFTGVMDPGFVIVSPSGTRTALPDLARGLRGAHGSWRKTRSRIEIRHLAGRGPVPGLFLAEYEEWHVDGLARSGRVSTALFTPDPDTPHGLRWLHVHETALPEG